MKREGRGELWGWVTVTALGALLVLLAAGRAWVRLLGQSADVAAPTGGELSPVLTPVALAGLAGVVAVLAAKGTGRRIVGGLLALCGLGAALGTWSALSGDAVADLWSERNVVRGVTDLSWEIAPLWPAVAGAGAVLLFAGGVFAIVRGNRWAGMSARYDRDGSGDQTRTQAKDDRALWDALDRGDDPTDSR